MVTAEEVGPKLSPSDGVEEASGTWPRPAEDTLRGGVTVAVSHRPTLASILGDMPGYFFRSVHKGRKGGGRNCLVKV